MSIAPNPTAEELYDALEASNIRLDKIWSGLKEVLARKMPDMVALYNEKNGRTGSSALVAPNEYYTGGEDLKEKPLPAIVVGGELEFSAAGPSAQFADSSTCIWVVCAPKTTRAAVRDATILAHLAWAVVNGYQRGYRNEANQRLWTGLTPSGVRAIPKNEQSLYGGFYIALDVSQGPSPTSASMWSRESEQIETP
ncbi:hypothetical protein EON83_11070 [bacterium]|nr:MAG: hypothetical protein EON83_11070 [bacterium]